MKLTKARIKALKNQKENQLKALYKFQESTRLKILQVKRELMVLNFPDAIKFLGLDERR